MQEFSYQKFSKNMQFKKSLTKSLLKFLVERYSIFFLQKLVKRKKYKTKK